MDVTSLMRRAAESFAGNEAVKHKDRSLTFEQAWARGCRLANALAAIGLQPGDRVATLDTNCLESVDAFLGVAIAGMVRVPLYARNSPSTHRIMMRNTDCKAIIVATEFHDDIVAAREGLPGLTHVIVQDAQYDEWLHTHPETDPMIEIDPDAIYIIRHTGGTTGDPKGVAYTHWSWLATARDWFYNYPPVTPGDSCLHVAPITHASGYWFIPIWIRGGRNVIANFTPEDTMRLVEQERINYLLVVPTMMAAMLEDPDIAKHRWWDTLKCLLITAAPISETTALKAYDVFGDILYQAYGQTEAVCVTSMDAKEWFGKVEGSTPARACGRVTAFARIEIRDEEGNRLPHGTAGEIVARIDGQMTGYWGNPEATKERLVDGWVKTGDIGIIDRNGYLYLLDRADDMIVSGGFNIWPLELENVIHSHPAVLEVAVVGVPHPKWGETPLATVVTRTGAEVSEDEIIALCVDKLGSYKKPSKVVFTEDPLPRTPVGKIRRKDLRETYWEGHTRRIAGS